MRWGVVLMCGLVAACTAPTPPPFKAIADTKLLMNAVIDPAADHIWESSGSDVTANGILELGPKNDEEWMRVRNSAVTLAEAGNLLMVSPRARDDQEWIRLSQALVDAGVSAIRAAEKHDLQQMFDAGGEVYAVCANCHSKYSPDIANRVAD
jgi:hypothetical protein